MRRYGMVRGVSFSSGISYVEGLCASQENLRSIIHGNGIILVHSLYYFTLLSCSGAKH